jgi:hypothetical protein
LKPPKVSPAPAQPSVAGEEKRRSQRVMVRVPVTLHIPGRETSSAVTIVVNDHGALILFREPLPAGAPLVLENDHTHKRVACHVTRAPKMTNEGALVPVEFEKPTPGFWNIVFPQS